MREAMAEFKNNPNPESLGTLKEGKLQGFRAYDLNQKYRILFSTTRTEGIPEVTMHKICDHKQAYLGGD